MTSQERSDLLVAIGLLHDLDQKVDRRFDDVDKRLGTLERARAADDAVAEAEEKTSISRRARAAIAATAIGTLLSLALQVVSRLTS